MKRSKHTFRAGQRRRLLPLIAVSILALLGIGGAIAFYSDSFSFANLFNLNHYEAQYVETFESPDNWKTCEEVPKTVITKNNSTVPFKVRLSYDEYWRNKEDSANLPLEKDGETLAIINFQNEDDWELEGNWYYYKQDVQPGESTTSLFKSVTLNCQSNLTLDNVCHQTETGYVCEKPEDDYENAKYHLNITVQTSTEEFSHDDEYYTLTVDPNGGTYNGSGDVHTEQVLYGNTVDLSSIAYTDHELVNWTKDNKETYNGTSIRITKNTTLKANWQSSLFHTVTVDPNGGTLAGSTNIRTDSIRQGTDYTLTNELPTREGYLFDGWFVSDDTELTNHTFTVMSDVTIIAHWSLAVAKNERTGERYRSITAAEADAQNGDTITLLVDTNEHFTNTKTITLNLGTHTVTGSITNNGNLTLINGEINNPDGIAVTNNSVFTMGINDFKDDNTVRILPNYIRVIGTTTGLKQNGEFYFYDGFIEGDVGLEGGYNGAPYYRNTFDDTIVYYFPLVDHNWEKDCQHVELAGSDNAVTKTKIGGDIYYYNLQDNINTSIRTGYKIYAVRNFDASYSVTSPADTSVVFDICGYNITINDTITINGTLTIEDSETTISTVNVADNSIAMPSVSGNVFVTPHTNNTATTITYGGLISAPQTIINHGNFIINNARITGTTANDTIKNYATLTMNGGALGATTGYTMQSIAGATYALDKNSYIYSSSTNRASVYTSVENLEWNDGNIWGQHSGVYINSGKLTVKNGTVFGGSYGITGTAIFDGGALKSTSCGANGGNVTINGGSIIVTATGSASSYGASGSNVTLNSGSIIVTAANGSVTGFSEGTTTINGGTVRVTGGSTTRAILYSYTTVTGGEIFATSTNSDAYGISGADSGEYKRISNAIITVSAKGKAYGIADGTSSAEFYVKNSTVTATSTTSSAIGIHVGGNQNATFTNSIVSGQAEAGQSDGIYVGNQNRATVIGGKVTGGTYGIRTNVAADRSSGAFATIGANDGEISTESPEIIGGSYGLYGYSFNFYDGVLRGNVKSYQEGTITGLPDGATYHTEESNSYLENTWLVNSEKYLEVGGVQYNSLTKAYEAITGNSGTIKVIADTSVESVLPHSPTDKNIIFDLNGHQLTYTQRFFNDGTMTILDSSEEKTGKLLHPGSDNATIVNSGNLTIESGYISAGRQAVWNEEGSTFTMTGGELHSTNIGIYNNGTSGTTDGKTRSVTTTIANAKIYGANYGIQNSNNYNYNTFSNTTITSLQYGIRYGTNTYNNESLVKSNLHGFDGGVHTLNNSHLEVTATGSASSYGASGSNVTLNSGSIIVTAANGSVTGFSEGTTTINGGTVRVTGGSTTRAILYSYTTVTGGEIFATSTNSDAYGISGADSGEYKRISNAIITVSAKGKAYGIADGTSSAEFYVKNSTVTATSTTSSAIGIHVGGNQNATFTNSIVSGQAEAGQSDGIYVGNQNRATVIGGKVTGGTYGIRTNVAADRSSGAFATIGANDGEISTESPEIIGGSYGLYGYSFNFYDGVLRGNVKSYQEGTIKSIADNSTINIENQTIDEVNYESTYLIEEHDVAKINSTKYKNLISAVEAANAGDIIELIDENYLFHTLTIPEEKDLTIKTNGYNIHVNNPIINNGKAAIINNSTTSSPAFVYHSSGYVITNNANAELSLDNIIIDAIYGINNMGTLTINNFSITSSNTAIKNTGTLTATNNHSTSASSYPIYVGGGTMSFEGGNIIGDIYVNSGQLSLINATATKNGKNIVQYITNKGTLTLDSSSTTLTNEEELEVPYSDGNMTRTIYNTGTLVANNSSSINYILNIPGKTGWENVIALYNDGGNATINNSSIIVTATEVGNHHYTNYGAYVSSGSFAIASGNIRVTAKGAAYGIWNNTGTSTIGVPEPQTSQNYGKDTADVSLTNPSITAIDTRTSGTRTGIAIKNNTGKVYYYDGKITGSTAAMPEKPTGVEYLYEPKDYIDEETGYHYRVLEWMREQAGSGN